MEYFLKLLLITICIFENAKAYNKSSESVDSTNGIRGRFSYLHIIEEDLLHQNWQEQEQPCLRQLLNIIRNVHNSTLWATWIWDSMQFPVGHLYGSRTQLGNFDQCMNFPLNDQPEFRTQYCLAELNLSEIDPEMTTVDFFGPVQKYIRYKTKHHLRYNELYWGICAPMTCKPESVIKFTNTLFRATHLGQMDIKINITVNSTYCQIAGEGDAYGRREYFTLSFFILLITTTLLCTIYVSFKGDEPNSSVSEFAKAFYIQRNAEWLIKPESQSVKSLLGVRLILTYLILCSHLWVIDNMFGVHNADETDKTLDSPLQRIRFNMDLVVDVFFMISGLLLAMNLLKINPKNFNMFPIIAMRYIRFLCSIIFILLIMSMALLRGDPGPLVKKHLQIEVDVCKPNWWKTVLMVGNYGDSEHICIPILWSMICEFHLFVIALILYWIYIKHKRAAIKAYVILTVASVVIPVIHGYINSSPPITLFDSRASDNYRKWLLGEPSYVRTHLRAGPYFVGIAFGYWISLFEPEKHRNTISKKLSILGFFALLFLMGSIFIASGLYNEHQNGPLNDALFSVMRRNGSAIIVGFFIIICEYGNLPVISSMLSCSALGPFNKLSFGVYTTHSMIISRFMSRTRVPLRSDLYQQIILSLGLLIILTIASLLLWLFWEAPILNVFAVIIKKAGNKKHQIKTDEKLGVTSPHNEEFANNNSEKKSN